MDQMLEEFMELVQIDSPSGQEAQLAAVLKAKLTGLGCQVRQTRPPKGGSTGNLIAVFPGQKPGSLLFSAHMDRVPQGQGIKPQLEDGVIRSDGSTILAADDLAGICAILAGLRQCQSVSTPRLEILFTVAEETGLAGSALLEANDLASHQGYVFDSAGPVGRIINGAPYAAALKVQVQGRAAHAGNEPEAGLNALKTLARILASLKEGRLDPESTANFAVIEASAVTNLVCARAEARGEARSQDQAKLFSYISYFKDHCHKLAKKDGARVQTSSKLSYPGFFIKPDDPVIEKVQTACQKLGIKAYCEKGGGGMDANRLNQLGITCVGLATGYYKNHSTDEKLVLADFLKAGQLAAALMQGS